MKPKYKRIAVTATFGALGLVLPLAAGSIHSHLASASNTASSAPTGTAAASMAVFSFNGTAASSAQLSALSTALGLGDPNGQTAATAGHLDGQSSSRALSIGDTTIVAVPTDAGQVCESTTDANGNGTSGCVRDLASLPGAVAPVVGSGSEGAYDVTGLAADSVRSVTVVTPNGRYSADLTSNGFAWNGTVADGAPTSLSVTSTGGQSATVKLG